MFLGNEFMSLALVIKIGDRSRSARALQIVLMVAPLVDGCCSTHGLQCISWPVRDAGAAGWKAGKQRQPYCESRPEQQLRCIESAACSSSSSSTQA